MKHAKIPLGAENEDAFLLTSVSWGNVALLLHGTPVSTFGEWLGRKMVRP